MPAPSPRNGGNPGWRMAGRDAEGWREEGQILPSSSASGPRFPPALERSNPRGGAEQRQGCCTAPPAVAPALNPPATAPGSPALAMGGDGLASRFPDFPRQHVLFMTPRFENETEIRGGRRGERGSRRVATTARGAISLQEGGRSRSAREELSCPAWGSHLHPPKYNRPGNKQELVFVSVHK